MADLFQQQLEQINSQTSPESSTGSPNLWSVDRPLFDPDLSFNFSSEALFPSLSSPETNWNEFSSSLFKYSPETVSPQSTSTSPPNSFERNSPAVKGFDSQLNNSTNDIILPNIPGEYQTASLQPSETTLTHQQLTQMQQFAPWFNQIPFNADPAAANLFLSTIFAAIIGNNAQSQISAGTQKSTTKGTRKRKNLSPEEKEERLKERVLRNRAAAQESRDKKRKQMEDLESQNKILTKQNADLTQRLMALETMNRTLMSKVDGIANKIAELPITPPSQRSSVDNDVALLNRTKYSGSPTTDFSLSPHADSAAVDVSRIIRPLKKPSVYSIPTAFFEGDHLIMPESQQRMSLLTKLDQESLKISNSRKSKSLVSTNKVVPKTKPSPIRPRPTSSEPPTSISTDTLTLAQSAHTLAGLVTTGIVQSMMYWISNSRKIPSYRQTRNFNYSSRWNLGWTFKGSPFNLFGLKQEFQGLSFFNKQRQDPMAFLSTFNRLRYLTDTGRRPRPKYYV